MTDLLEKCKNLISLTFLEQNDYKFYSLYNCFILGLYYYYYYYYQYYYYYYHYYYNKKEILHNNKPVLFQCYFYTTNLSLD